MNTVWQYSALIALFGSLGSAICAAVACKLAWSYSRRAKTSVDTASQIAELSSSLESLARSVARERMRQVQRLRQEESPPPKNGASVATDAPPIDEHDQVRKALAARGITAGKA